MFTADKNMWLGIKKRSENQLLLAKRLRDHTLVFLIQIKDAKLTFHECHIFNDLVSLRLAKIKVVFFTRIFFNKLNKCIYRKRVMLCGDAKISPPLSLICVLFFEQLCLLQYLPCVSKKDLALLRYCHTSVGTDKNRQIHFLFQLSNCSCQTRLCYKKPFCRLCDCSHRSDGDGILQLL